MGRYYMAEDDFDADTASVVMAALKGAAKKATKMLCKPNADLSQQAVETVLRKSLEDQSKFVSPELAKFVNYDTLKEDEESDVNLASFVGAIKGSIATNKAIKVADAWKILDALKQVAKEAKSLDLEAFTKAALKISRGVTTKMAGVAIGYFAMFGLSSEDVVAGFSTIEESVRSRMDDLITEVAGELFDVLAQRVKSDNPE